MIIIENSFILVPSLLGVKNVKDLDLDKRKDTNVFNTKIWFFFFTSKVMVLSRFETGD